MKKDRFLVRAIIFGATAISFPIGIAAGLTWIAVQYLRD